MGSKPTVNTIGIVAVAALAAKRRRRRLRVDQADLPLNEVGGHCRQPIVPAVCKVVLDRHVLAFDKPSLAQTPAKRRDVVGSLSSGPAAQITL